MKKTFKLLASLTFGLMVASCQNGLEEVINESTVQDELATTRAEDEATSDNDETPVRYATGPAIFGPSIITDTSPHTYRVDDPSENARTEWAYSSSIFSSCNTCSNDSTLILTLNNASIIADATITATFYNSSNNVISQSRFDIGINGPHYNDCSIRVLRSSDGAEVYPSHNVYLEPNTYYYAYFSTTSGGSNMSLTWTFYDDEVDIISQYGYTLYFKTGNIDNCFLHIDGKLYGSSITKSLLGIVLY